MVSDTAQRDREIIKIRENELKNMKEEVGLLKNYKEQSEGI